MMSFLTVLLGTGWLYSILSRIGCRPCLMAIVSGENSGHTAQRNSLTLVHTKCEDQCNCHLLSTMRKGNAKLPQVAKIKHITVYQKIQAFGFSSSILCQVRCSCDVYMQLVVWTHTSWQLKQWTKYLKWPTQPCGHYFLLKLSPLLKGLPILSIHAKSMKNHKCSLFI